MGSIGKAAVTFLLFMGGAACIAIGLLPFINNEAGMVDFANLGFIALHVIFMIGYFKTSKTSRFVFWASTFGLIIYTNLMFIFYESLFEE